MLRKYKNVFVHHKQLATGLDNQPFKRKADIQLKPLLLVLLMLASVIMPLLQSNTAYAAPNPPKNSDDWAVQSILYYGSLTYCIAHGKLDSNMNISNYITVDNAKNKKWFKSSGASNIATALGMYMQDATTSDTLGVGSDGFISCDGALVSSALSLWGLNPIEVLCNSGFSFYYQSSLANKYESGECVKKINIDGLTSGELRPSDMTSNRQNTAKAFSDYIIKTIYNGDTPKLTPAQQYIYYRHSLNNQCIAGIDNKSPNNPTTVPTGNKIYTNTKWVPTIPPSTMMTPQEGWYEGSDNTSTKIVIRPWQNIAGGNYDTKFYSNDQGTWESCKTIAKWMSDNAQSYLDKYIKLSAEEKAKAADNEAQALAAQNSDKNTPNNKTCGSEVHGIGWIICPVITALTGLNDAAWGITKEILNVNPLSQTDSSGKESTIYTAWGAIRNIANIVFVIMFMIIIFSQISNMGIDNYGIKKLLPRIIVGAILVNISFVVVQVAVDLANIIGSSLYSLLKNLVPTFEPKLAWGGLITTILGTGGFAIGGVVVAGGIAAAFWILLPGAVMGALALLAAILSLIFRQAIIPVLAIIAPLAFVAYLLPNTAPWFKKWKDMFLSMLMLYPLAALVFGGAQLVASIIMGNGENAWSTFEALIILSLPLFSLPFLVSKSGSIVSGVGTALNKLGEKARKPLENYSQERQALAKAKTLGDSPRRGISGMMQRSVQRREGKIGDRKRDTETYNTRFKAAWDKDKGSESAQNSIHANEEAKLTDSDNKLAYRRTTVGKRMARALKSSDIKNKIQDEKDNKAFSFTGKDDIFKLKNATGKTKLAESYNDLEYARNPNNSKLIQQQMVVDKQIGTEKIKANTGFITSEAGSQVVLEEGVAKLESNTAEAKATTRLETDSSSFNVRNENVAANLEKEAAVNDNKQLATEATTESEDGRLSQIDTTVRARIQKAQQRIDITKAATASAERIQQQELQKAYTATSVGANGETVASTAATLAAGIDLENGIPRVQAKATSEIARAKNENISAAKTLFSSLKYASGFVPGEPENELLTVAKGQLRDKSPATIEQQLAAFDTLVQEGDYNNMASLLDYVANQAENATTPSEINTATELQQYLKNLFASSSKKPKSVGGKILGQLSTGEFKSGLNRPNLSAAETIAFATITGPKLAARTFVSMDPDEMIKINEVLSKTKSLSSDEQKSAINIVASIKEALTDPRISADLTDQQKDILGNISDRMKILSPESNTENTKTTSDSDDITYHNPETGERIDPVTGERI